MFFKSKSNKKPAFPVLSGRHHAPEVLGDVLVLGLGVSGKATVNYLVSLADSRISSITVLAGESKEDAVAWAAEVKSANCALSDAGKLTFLFDTEDAASVIPAGKEKFDICIASPGISMFCEMYINGNEASKRTISEVEFAWGESALDSKWIAITGTNGKTTTTALVEHILKRAGLRASAVGNIGEACIAQVARDIVEDDALSASDKEELVPYYVVEVSSFQLASIDAFAPDVAVILGIKPDHIEWHKTHEHYVASKMKQLDNLSCAQGGVAVLDATSEEVRVKIRELKKQLYAERGFSYIPIGSGDGIDSDMRQKCGSENAAFVGGQTRLEVAFGRVEHILTSAHDLQLKGAHNLVNALAAASAAVAVGVSDADIDSALCDFKALAHRIEPVGEARNIAFYNDSKATNVDSAICGLSAFGGQRVAILLGGHDKMTSLDELVEACRDNASLVVCFGEAGKRFFDAMSPLEADPSITVMQAGNLKDAFDLAVNTIPALDEQCNIVLLSPACSSYDEFTCFEERGDYFRKLVQDLAQDT